MSGYRIALGTLWLLTIAALAFGAGLLWASKSARAADSGEKRKPRVVYPKKTKLDFEGINIEGEIHNPAEFYFQYRKEEKFDSLVERRKNFHREMLRDAVLSK